MRLSFVTPIIAGVLVSALPIAEATMTREIEQEAGAAVVRLHSSKQSTGMQEGGSIQRLPISGPGRPL